MNHGPLGTVAPNLAGPKYRVLGQIGQGQFGQVFCGIHRTTGQIVALKQLDSRQLSTPRFLHELNLLASLQHPNIVAFHTLEYSESGRYLSMAYCAGGTLRQLINPPGQLTLKQALQLVIDVLRGLIHAHQHGIVHCDLKPENVLLTLTKTGWRAHLSDFGVARWLAETDTETRRGDTGSPAYMAPERFYSHFSPASDLYAAGILLYELVVGHRPFTGTPGDLMTAHLNHSLEFPETIPTVVSNIIEQATQKLPQKRFDSAQTMLQAIHRAAKVEDRPKVIAPKIQPSSLDQAALASPVLTLATQADRLYCGLPSQVLCRSLKPLGLGDPVPYPMTQGQVMQIWDRPQGLFVRTQQAQTHTLSYLPPDPEDRTSQNLSAHVLGSWQSTSLQMDIAPNGRWVGVATSGNPSQDQCQILRLPTLKPLRAITGAATNLLTLDNHHGLMVIPLAQGVCLRFLNRRGNTLDYCQLPLQPRQIIQGQGNPYQILAVAAEASFWVTLNPLLIKRITLPIAPTMGIATPWGYLLANQTGGIALIHASGKFWKHLTLPLGNQERVSAIASYQSRLIVATWSGQQGTLYSFDLGPFIHQ